MKTKTEIFIVPEEFNSQRLDKFLANLDQITSRSFAQDLILKNLVLVDGVVARSSFSLKTNQKVEIHFPEAAEPSVLKAYDFKLDIIFEDKDLIVVNKPSGLVVHPAAGHHQDTLVNALLHHTTELSMKNEQRPGIVHRIDKETSGLLVVAKNDQAHENLAAQFKNKTSHRIYYALVDGAFPKLTGSIRSYLARHPLDRKRFASIKENNRIITDFREDFETGKWAVTHYERLAQSSGMTYMKLKLETGRTHQIRVHMSEMGHRLVGDATYGYSQQKAKQHGIDRFLLHAAELGFVHPTTNENLLFKVPWPDADLAKLKDLGFKNELLRK